eukprot:SAG31_NODE_30938_length_374_cov_0.938182_1_plen_51_part_10
MATSCGDVAELLAAVVAVGVRTGWPLRVSRSLGQQTGVWRQNQQGPVVILE